MNNRFILFLLYSIYSVILSAQEQERITLLFVGDLMQHQAQIDAACTDSNTYDYSSCFSLVKKQISQADIAIGNLEVVLGGEPYRGYPAFSAPDEYLYAIKDAGFDVLLTANNHCLDRGKKGLERTITMLDSLQIRRVGTYRDSTDFIQNDPLLISYKSGSWRIALLNYTYGTNGLRPTSPNRVNYINKDRILQDIRIAQAWHSDVIIACMHWGDEYHSLPNNEQRQLAQWMFAHGVDHIVGSHPHVIQPLELHTDSVTGKHHLLAYSLGNFISNMSKMNTDGGLVLTLQLEKQSSFGNNSYYRTNLTHCEYNLVWTGRPILIKKKNFMLFPSDYPLDSLSITARNRLSIFLKNSRNLLQKYNKCVFEK